MGQGLMHTEIELPLVSFEQAKMLKEVGFNWTTYHLFKFKTKKLKRYNEEVSRVLKKHNDIGAQWVSRPPLLMAISWLREEKRIFLFGICEKRWQWTISRENKFYLAKATETYDTSAEAESAGLTHVLKILLNNKKRPTVKQRLTIQIAGAYLNAQMIMRKGVYNIVGTSLDSGISNGIILCHQQYKIFRTAKIGACKLILTPIPEITDEHIVQAAKLASYHPDFKEDWDNIIADFRVDDIIRHPDRVEVKHTCICFEGSFNLRHDGSMYFTGEDEGVSAQPTVYLPHYAIDHLRQKNYDCGYAHIPSLIDAGIAINSNSIKS